MTQPQRQFPRLSETNLKNYMRQLWGIYPPADVDWRQYLDHIIASDGVRIPEGMSDAELMWEKINVIGTIWTLRERSQFVRYCLDMMQEGDPSLYLILVDSSIPGKDGLFLVSCEVTENDMEGFQTSQDNILYMTESWSALGGPPKLISGRCKLKSDGMFSAIAVQLSSLNLKE